jgi:hypothetical protein
MITGSSVGLGKIVERISTVQESRLLSSINHGFMKKLKNIRSKEPI